MSKLPNHSLWARATASSSSTSGRVTLLAKHHSLSASSVTSTSSSALTATGGPAQTSSSSSSLSTSSPSSQRQRAPVSSSGGDALNDTPSVVDGWQTSPIPVSTEQLVSLGAVSAPFFGPQTAEVTEALESAITAATFANLPANSRYDGFIASPMIFSSSSSTSMLPPLTSASILRNMQTPPLVAPRPHRAALHLWSQAHQSSSLASTANVSATAAAAAAAAAVSASSTAVSGSPRALTEATTDPSTASRSSLSKVERRRRQKEKARGKAPHMALSSTIPSSDKEKLEELFLSLMNAMHQSGNSRGAIGAENAEGDQAGSSGWASARDHDPSSSGANLLEEVMFAPPSSSAAASSSSPSSSPSNGSPSPSPSPFDSNFSSNAFGPHVTSPHRSGSNKLATTTSSEVGLSNSLSSSTSSSSSGSGAEGPLLAQQTSSTSSSSSASNGSSSGHNANLASSTAGMSSSSSHGHQAGQPGPPSKHWARSFELPRSSKRHDFTFEHGAYGIPKRHPLSSIRNGKQPAITSRGAQNASGDGAREAPGPEEVPTSKVKAATRMLYAAADFLAGPQTVPDGQGVSRTHRPMSGEEALNMALSGGSTADGSEVLSYHAYGARRSPGGKAKATSSPNKMAIRDTDGRIIKDRLRSVQVGEDAYFLRPDSLGVADGVGGWASRPGADPALFSRLLMHFCAVELSRYDGLSAAELAADNGSLLHAWRSVDPVEVMHRAWERCVRASRREGILGSSTALIALLRGDELRIANVGDCVLLIIRQGDLLFRSTEQQHSFNFPVQLGMMGDTTQSVKKRTEAANKARDAALEKERGSSRSTTLEDYDDVEDEPQSSLSSTSIDGGAMAGVKGHAAAEGEAEGAGALGGGSGPTTETKEEGEEQEPEWDEPRRDAGRWTVRVEAGDIIVVGSDGLMDNLFDEDIIEEVLRFLPPQPQQQADGIHEASTYAASSSETTFSPQLVSEALCSRAKAVSEDGRAISSPFQQRAMEEGLNYVGGKHDDISVLVCLVGEREEGGGLTTGATTPHAGAMSARSEGDEKAGLAPSTSAAQGSQDSKENEKKLGLTSHASRVTAAANGSSSAAFPTASL